MPQSQETDTAGERARVIGDGLPAEGYVNAKGVRAFFGDISAPTQWRLQKRGILPPPDISEGKVRLWDVETLRARRARRRKIRPEPINQHD